MKKVSCNFMHFDTDDKNAFLSVTDYYLIVVCVDVCRRRREAGILFIHLSVDPLVDMSWLLWISQVQICQGYAEHIGVQAECMVVLTLIL